MRLILIRHGEIDSNSARIYSGRSEEPLNAHGREQAEAAAGQMEKMRISSVFSSPLRRAVETASIISRRVSLEPQIAVAFNELRMGPWEGLSEVQVEAMYPQEFEVWNSRPADLRIDGRETLEELQLRALRGVIEMEDRQGLGLPIVVSHVAVIRVLMLHAQGRSLNDYKKIHVPNATPLPITLDPKRPGPCK